MSAFSDDFVFPENPFEDVNPSDFNKLNKKEVTEDFVGENFRLLGWHVYKPFTDTGIDRIIVKLVCRDGHTALNEESSTKECSACGKPPIEISRFIQVKTRKLVDDVFGFTLKPKDIRVDPRHVYLLYSDNTTKDKQDFLIVPVKELLSFFDTSKINPFRSKAFRTGNNKLNSLSYDLNSDTWAWNSNSWEKFRNKNGLKLLQNPQVDLNINEEIKLTRNLANKLQHSFSKGRSYSSKTEKVVNNELSKRLSLYTDKSKILEIRSKVDSYLSLKCSPDTLESSRRYFENVKLVDTLGDDEDESRD
jgi:hypothetical protein